MIRDSALLLLPLVVAALSPAQSRPHVIVETDLAADSDDAALVAFANRLADLGAIELLGVMHNGNNDWGAAAISAINTYYGRPLLPIGTYRTAQEAGRPDYHPLVDPANPAGPRRPLSYAGTTEEGRWVRLLAETLPCRYARRLDFPDAVDLYPVLLERAPDASVVIVNGGYLGNLSNLVARFDADPALAALFQRKVARMTGAVGGVNTCGPQFPRGMAEHVLENPRWPTALITSLGLPVLDDVAVASSPAFATRMAIDHPVREAYRYKTEVEMGRRGSSIAWNWHIFDVLTCYSTIAWDRHTSPRGVPYFELGAPSWLDVRDNCSATFGSGAPPAPHLRFRMAGAHVPPGGTVADISRDLARVFFDDGLFQPPARPWTEGRDHLAVTAMFDDGTFGGFDFADGNGATAVAGGRLRAPSNTVAAWSGAELIAEGRRYRDQTAVVRVARLPDVARFSPAETGQVGLDYVFWGDVRATTVAGAAPLVRVVAWPGRGAGQPGRPVHRCEVWDPSAHADRPVAAADVPWVAVGAPFTLRVEIGGGTVQASLEGRSVFPAPVVLASVPPADGGMTKLHLRGECPADAFELDYVLLRPSAGPATDVDVHVDKVGTVWFSYVKNGDVAEDLFGHPTSLAVHHVDLELAPRPGWPSELTLRMPWLDASPHTLDWLDLVLLADWQGLGTDHWVYGLRGIPWGVGDRISLEFRGDRESERVPALLP